MSNPTLRQFCLSGVGRADIEGSKSHVAMNAWRPQASYPCGNFSVTSGFNDLNINGTKGSLGPAFTAWISTDNREVNGACSPYALHVISVHTEHRLGHLRYCLTGEPPQPNSPPGFCPTTRVHAARLRLSLETVKALNRKRLKD